MNDKERWVLEWFKKADSDLRAAEVLISLEDPSPDIVCFHTQQCVEKYLKGFLSFHEREFAKTHDLVELLTECENVDSSFAEWEEICRLLTIYSVASRYPDISREYTVDEAKEAISFANDLKDFVRRKAGFGER